MVEKKITHRYKHTDQNSYHEQVVHKYEIYISIKKESQYIFNFQQDL